MTAIARNNTTWQQFYKPHVLQSNSQGLKIGGITACNNLLIIYKTTLYLYKYYNKEITMELDININAQKIAY